MCRALLGHRRLLLHAKLPVFRVRIGRLRIQLWRLPHGIHLCRRPVPVAVPARLCRPGLRIQRLQRPVWSMRIRFSLLGGQMRQSLQLPPTVRAPFRLSQLGVPRLPRCDFWSSFDGPASGHNGSHGLPHGAVRISGTRVLLERGPGRSLQGCSRWLHRMHSSMRRRQVRTRWLRLGLWRLCQRVNLRGPSMCAVLPSGLYWYRLWQRRLRGKLRHLRSWPHLQGGKLCLVVPASVPGCAMWL